MSLIGTVLRTITERQAAGKSTADLLSGLEESAGEITQRLATAADTPGNREVAAHVIGIERWGDRRLRVALGEPMVSDEYDDYRPSLDTDMAAMAELFAQTRAETVALAHRAAALPESATAPHNDMGDISVGAWLIYLRDHADRETKRRLKGN
jgi:hypothetical protein